MNASIDDMHGGKFNQPSPKCEVQLFVSRSTSNYIVNIPMKLNKSKPC